LLSDADFFLSPGSQYSQAVPEGWTAFVYILEVLAPQNIPVYELVHFLEDIL
jgi:hypothetical protein